MISGLGARDLFWFLGSVIIAGFVALFTGVKVTKNKITVSQCDERRQACLKLNDAKQEALTNRLSQIETKVNHIDEKIDKLLMRNN